MKNNYFKLINTFSTAVLFLHAFTVDGCSAKENKQRLTFTEIPFGHKCYKTLDILLITIFHISKTLDMFSWTAPVVQIINSILIICIR